MKIDLPSSFGLFHANIASLNKHIDDLRDILSLVNYKFDVIGISEHKIRKDTAPSNNVTIPGYNDVTIPGYNDVTIPGYNDVTIPGYNDVTIPGYNEFIFELTQTTHGDTGFYIKDNVDYTQRKDLQISSPGDFETMFLEIQFTKKRTLIVGCIYRHPSSAISVHEFTFSHRDPILEKINGENKECVLMGDFNIDLLKLVSHNESSDFYNSISSHFFTPYILQPT